MTQEKQPKFIRCVALAPGVLGVGRGTTRIRVGQEFDVEEGITGDWFRPVDPAVELKGLDPEQKEKQQRLSKVFDSVQAKRAKNPRSFAMSEMNRDGMP